MKAIAAIEFACNDPDNGLFAGRAAMATFGDAEIEAPNFDTGYRFSEGIGGIMIHRRVFQVVDSKEWFGNWCWNRYMLPRSEMKRLLLTLRERGWRVTTGPDRFYRWWNRVGLS